MMRGFFTFIIDLIFPPRETALELRALSPAILFQKLPRASTPPHPFITSIFAYKNPLVKELIWSMKYKKDKHAIRLGGYALYERLKGSDASLIPIPISNKRRKERGYNQCELLIDEIIELDKEKKFEKRFDILKRNKHTDRQTLKNREERLGSAENIFDAIAIHLENPIVIIDDVATTGSTLLHAREALLRAGHTDVRAMTLAH